MIELTPAQQYLIKWLKVMKVGKEEMIGIMMLLKTPIQMDEMMDWLCHHQKATPSEIVGKALEISKQTKN